MSYFHVMSSLPHLVSTDAVTALGQLCEQYPEQVVFTTSLGLEDQALTDLIARNNLPVRLVTLDTGRLFPETYDLIDRPEQVQKLGAHVFFSGHLCTRSVRQ